MEHEDAPAGVSPPHAPPLAPTKEGGDDKEDDNDKTDEDRWDGRRGRHNKHDKHTTASAPAGGAGGPGRKSVATTPPIPPELQSPISPSTCLPSSTVKLPPSVFSQYGSNLTESGDIFPMVAKIMNQAVEQPQPQMPAGLSDTEPPQLSLSLICDTPDDPKNSGQSSPTPGQSHEIVPS